VGRTWVLLFILSLCGIAGVWTLVWTITQEPDSATVEVLAASGAFARAAVPDLMKSAAEDDDAEVRAACINALGSVDEFNPALRDLLVRAVEDPAPDPCHAAINAMGALGRPAVPLLSRCLVHHRPAVSELAAWQLRDMEADVVRGAAPDLVENLFAVLANP